MIIRIRKIAVVLLTFCLVACGQDTALPTETATRVQVAAPREAATETRAPPTATATSTEPDRTPAPLEGEDDESVVLSRD